MRALAVLVSLAAAASVVTSGPTPPDLSFDTIDLDKYNDKKALANFVKCMADKTRVKGCTDIEINIRERAPGIVANDCADCTPNEKEAVVFLTSNVATFNKDAADLTKLLKEFDPTGKNSRKYLEALNKIKTKRKIPKLSDSILNKYPAPNTGCFD